MTGIAVTLLQAQQERERLEAELAAGRREAERVAERSPLRNSTNGAVVSELEREFAKYVKADYAVALANGTATLHTALVACDVGPGWGVVVPPLTMASTTLGVLHAGARVHFGDVDLRTWLLDKRDIQAGSCWLNMPVSLYGLWSGFTGVIEDAAQTVNPHRAGPIPPAWTKERRSEALFTSYSFQASKILSAGEGGMLVTNSAVLAERARRFSRLGYPNGKVEDLKRPDAIRHVAIGYNYRMADCQAALVLEQLAHADELLALRRHSALCYTQAISGCDWITPQYVPDGWPHSYWCYGIALKSPAMWEPFAQAIQNAGGERPYAAWRLTYQEPAFRHLAPDGTCPVAEDLQPRLMQLQTNHDRAGSERAAEILHKAIQACKF